MLACRMGSVGLPLVVSSKTQIKQEDPSRRGCGERPNLATYP